MASLFYDESLADTGEGLPEVGAVCRLSGAEAHHAAVNRLRPGETVSVGDGAGTIVTGPVVTLDREGLAVRVERRVRKPRPAPRLGLAQALAKGGRDELAVQAATELGVDVVVPWMARRSVARWSGQKRDRGPERWRAIVREAGKQSLRAWLPEVLPPHSTAELAGLAGVWQLAVLDPASNLTMTAWLGTGPRAQGGGLSAAGGGAAGPDRRDVLLVVGPEGGIAADEARLLEEAGAARLRLGQTVLRTSTAGPAAIAVWNACGGRRW
ncbi:MAG TPA: 16S rRNA (uracil(1498)-N(3))-methyltransferase [Microbacteriaceae bacterium]|nr:16S rRNA (uracil(1498)-N(3))-methyltransferase [Microbacteriaceae bacterium]